MSWFDLLFQTKRQKRDNFYAAAEAIPHDGTKDPRLDRYSVGQLFRANLQTTNPGLAHALVEWYGKANYNTLNNLFGATSGSGYAGQEDFAANFERQRAINTGLQELFR